MSKYLLLSMLFVSNLLGVNYVDILNGIESETAKTLESTYKMSVCGTGGGAMYGIDSVMLAFDIRRPVMIEDARAIVIGSAELYIKDINANKAIRPYLEEYPFTAKRVRLIFYVHSSDKKPIDSFSLSCGGNIKVPTVEYNAHDENNGLIEVYSETYEKAKERLNAISK